MEHAPYFERGTARRHAAHGARNHAHAARRLNDPRQRFSALDSDAVVASHVEGREPGLFRHELGELERLRGGEHRVAQVDGEGLVHCRSRGGRDTMSAPSSQHEHARTPAQRPAAQAQLGLLYVEPVDLRDERVL